jgi:hypothetical protein
MANVKVVLSNSKSQSWLIGVSVGHPGSGRSALLEREVVESPTAICLLAALDAARLTRKAVTCSRRIGPGRDRRLRGHGQTGEDLHAIFFPRAGARHTGLRRGKG